MILRLAYAIAGTHKYRLIAILLLFNFWLAQINHYIESGEFEEAQARLGAKYSARGLDPLTLEGLWLHALFVTGFVGFIQTVIAFTVLLVVPEEDHYLFRFRGSKYIIRVLAVAYIIIESRNLAGVRCHYRALRARLRLRY